MLFNPKNILHLRILGILLSSGSIAILVICGFWYQSESISQRRQIEDKLRSTVTITGNSLKTIIQRQIRTAQIISHSVSLRSYIIKIGQEKVKLPANEVWDELHFIDQHWDSLPVTDLEVSQVCESLESRYLKDTVSQSEGIIEWIEVTDVFGAVRIASSRPERFLVFEEPWWQKSLMVYPDMVHQRHIIQDKGSEILYWDLCLPLRNDDGIDAVGVIRIRLRLDLIFKLSIDDAMIAGVSTLILADQQIRYPSLSNELDLPRNKLQKTLANPRRIIYDPQTKLLISSMEMSKLVDNVMPYINWMVAVYQYYPPDYSVENPIFKKALAIGLLGIIILLILSIILTKWITDPLAVLIQSADKMAKGQFDVRVPEIGKGEIWLLSRFINTMAEKLRETRNKIHKLHRERTGILKAISDYTLESSLKWDSKEIADILLRVSGPILSADAGIIVRRDSNHEVETLASFGLDERQKKLLTPFLSEVITEKRLFFAWQHPEFKSLWDHGMQVFMMLPIQDHETVWGTIYFLFMQAPDYDLESESMMELLASQAAINFSRAKLHNELVHQKNFIEGILSGIPSLICTIDEAMKITWHNQQLPPSLLIEDGMSLVGSHCCSSLRNRSSTCPDCPVKMTFEDREPHQIIQRWMLKNGQFRWVQASSYPIQNKTGNVTSVILIAMDVTQKMEEESAYRRFSRAIESIGEAVIITDIDGRIVFVNPSFTEIFGFKIEQVLEQSIKLIFPPDTIDLQTHILSRTRSGKGWREEMELLDHYGRKIQVSLTCSVVKDANEFPIGLVFTCFDLTSRIKREKQLIRQYRELELLNRISSILNDNFIIDEMIKKVLIKICEFSDTQSGLAILFEEEGESEHSNRRPQIVIDRKLPTYLLKYIEEIRYGRFSTAYEKSTQFRQPTIFNDLENCDMPEIKLVARIGFKSLEIIPIRSSESTLGFIVIFSQNAFHFKPENIELFQSLANQVGIAIHNRLLQQKMLKETRYNAAGEIVAQIGGDVKHVLQGLESSRKAIDSALKIRNMERVYHGWLLMSRQIWQLYQVTLNILDYPKETPKFFFPEDLNKITRQIIDQIKSMTFSRKISLHFEPCLELGDVYINRVAIARTISNLLALAVDACWNTPKPEITVTLNKCLGSDDRYEIVILHNGPKLPTIELSKEMRLDLADSGFHGAGLILSSLQKTIQAHDGLLYIEGSHKKTSYSAFRIDLPRFPSRK